MGTLGRIFKNTLFLSASGFAGSILNFIALIVIARHLGGAEFGIYSFIFAFVAIFDIFNDVGLSTLLVREVSRAKDKAQYFLFYSSILKVVLGVLSFAALVAALYFTGHPPKVFESAMILGIAYFLFSFSRLLLSFFKAVEAMQYEAVLNFAERASILLGVLALIFFGVAGIFEIVLLYLAVAVAKMFVTAYLTFAHFWKKDVGFHVFDANFSLSILKKAAPFAMVSVFSVIYFNVDMLIISFFRSDAEIGLYNAVYRVVFGAGIIPAAFTIALYPVISRFYSESKDRLGFVFNKSLKYLLLVAFPVSIGVYIYAASFVRFFYGSEFYGAISALQILAPLCAVIYVSNLASSALAGINRQMESAAFALSNLVLVVVLGVLLVPSMGIEGAAWATLIAETFSLALAFWVISKEIKIVFSLQDFARLLAGSAAMAAIALFLSQVPSAVAIPVCAAAFFAIMFALGYFEKDDLKMISYFGHASVNRLKTFYRSFTDGN